MHSRRQFLVQGSVGVAAGLLGCASSSKTKSKSDPIPTPTPSPTPTATAEDLASLARSLEGSVVAKGNAGYDEARLLYNTRFDDARPLAVVYCASADDVAKTVAWADRTHTAFAIRSGGHSYAGYSSSDGIVVDVSRLNAIELDGDIVSVGAGAKLIDLYAALAPAGLAVPAGSCPTVGVAGLALGGGIGPLGRKFGLTCDSLVSVEIVVASGEIVRCDGTANTDLFWACRGGGGGNFGVVTRLWFRAHPVTDATVFSFAWPIADAEKIVEAWQGWGPDAPDALFSICGVFSGGRLSSGEKDVAFVTVYGFHLGSSAELETLVAPLFAKTGSPTDRSVKTDGFLASILAFAYCEKLSQCHLAPAGTLERETYAAKSRMTRTNLSTAGIAALVDGVRKRQADPLLENGGFMLDAQGGAIGRVSKDATAFVHRDVRFSAQFLAGWQPSDDSEVAARNQEWLRAIDAAAQFDAGAYQNYIDPELTDWRVAYYGENYSRLQQVKARWDPRVLFRFAQSITA